MRLTIGSQAEVVPRTAPSTVMSTAPSSDIAHVASQMRSTNQCASSNHARRPSTSSTNEKLPTLIGSASPSNRARSGSSSGSPAVTSSRASKGSRSASPGSAVLEASSNPAKGGIKGMAAVSVSRSVSVGSNGSGSRSVGRTPIGRSKVMDHTESGFSSNKVYATAAVRARADGRLSVETRRRTLQGSPSARHHPSAATRAHAGARSPDGSGYRVGHGGTFSARAISPPSFRRAMPAHVAAGDPTPLRSTRENKVAAVRSSVSAEKLKSVRSEGSWQQVSARPSLQDASPPTWKLATNAGGWNRASRSLTQTESQNSNRAAYTPSPPPQREKSASSSRGPSRKSNGHTPSPSPQGDRLNRQTPSPTRAPLVSKLRVPVKLSSRTASPVQKGLQQAADSRAVSPTSPGPGSPMLYGSHVSCWQSMSSRATSPTSPISPASSISLQRQSSKGPRASSPRMNMAAIHGLVHCVPLSSLPKSLDQMRMTGQ